MLISRNLDFQVLDTFTDVAENILGLHITIHNHPFILTSVYGPNTVDLNFLLILDVVSNSIRMLT